ncbi:MAG: hypothetical protein GY938_27415, partial [Ketobacter sp.]|nr:hypothetical protein [Ketobacter sp.]
TEANIYNTNQQLCLKVRTDVGATAYGYNALGEMTWSAQGVAYNKITPACIDKPTTNVINYIADNQGDIKKIDYVETLTPGVSLTPDVTYKRDGNGNVTKITAGNVVQTYHYNNQNLLEGETLAIGTNKTFDLDYGYNSLLHNSFITYPDKLASVEFLPNAYGEPTQAIRTYADSTTDEFVKGNTDKAIYNVNGV